MKRVVAAMLVILTTVVLAAFTNSSHLQPERTLILRVRTIGPLKNATFSGQLVFDTGSAPTVLNRQSTPFGIKVRTNSLKGSIQKDAGAPDLLVELIDFGNEREVGSITKTGSIFDIDAHQSNGKGVLSIR